LDLNETGSSQFNAKSLAASPGGGVIHDTSLQATSGAGSQE